MVVQNLTLLVGVICALAFLLGVAGMFRRSLALMVSAGALAVTVGAFALTSLAFA